MGAHALQIGRVVQTRELGPAEVVKLTRKGVLVALQDMGGLEIEIALEDLILASGAETADATDSEAPLVWQEAPAPAPAPAADPGRTAVALAAAEPAGAASDKSIVMVVDRNLASFPQRQALEALRFGLVPTQAIEKLTLGFPRLKAWVESRFPGANQGQPQVAEIVGPFGTGKSHAMAVVRYLAKEAGYLTARVEVDGQTITLSDPARLLYSLWSTLAGPRFASQTPMLDLFLQAIEAGNPPPQMVPMIHRDQIQGYYETIQAVVKVGKVEKYREVLEAGLTCSTDYTVTEIRRRLAEERTVGIIRVQQMIGSRSVRPLHFTSVLAGVAQVAKLAGYKGLVLTIDEFEVEHYLATSRLNDIRGIMTYLAEYVAGQTHIESAPLALFFATVGDDGHRGNVLVDQLIDATGGGYYELETLAAEERHELARRIHGIYEGAYGLGVDFDPAVAVETETELEDEGYSDSGLIRAFIKLYVSKLDSRYGPPNVSPTQL